MNTGSQEPIVAGAQEQRREMTERGAITAFFRNEDGHLVVKIDSNFDSLGDGYRSVLRLSDKVELKRGDVIELIWERGK